MKKSVASQTAQHVTAPRQDAYAKERSRLRSGESDDLRFRRMLADLDSPDGKLLKFST